MALQCLAEVALLQGRLSVAERRYHDALAVVNRLGARGALEADIQYGLGRVHQKASRLAQAAEAFKRAIDVLERRRRKLGGADEARGGFSVVFARWYQDAIESLAALGRAGDAFHVLERSRARLLLDMLVERDLALPAELPPDLARERQLNVSRYDRAQAELARLSPDKDGAEIERLLHELRELRAEDAELTAHLRAASPRWASLHYPEPLEADAAARALDPGTALAAFAVGSEKTLLFVLRAVADGRGARALSVFTLPIGEKALRARIESFRRLIAVASPDQRLLKARAAALYDLLLRPADAILARSERVAISPDGPLHLLPFGVLARKDAARSGGAGRSWLIEWKPIYVVASATHHAELKKARRDDQATDGRLVAFGDPSYPQAVATASIDSIPDPEVRRARERGFEFAPLPYARQEVEAISALFGPRAAAYLGAEASESRVKTAAKGSRYVHFASHAVLDPRLPINSALVLAIPETTKAGEDNGLLQVWEILDTLQLDAELVTLSGCETALGEEMGGEGLMSLTRAFHYAGARSVVASLWRVPDQSTADLMVRFYGHIKEGRSKVDALRLAQLDLIRSGTKAAHPFRWAAFSVFGDWR